MVLQGISFMAVILGVGVLFYQFYKNWEVHSYNTPYRIYDPPTVPSDKQKDENVGVRRRKLKKSDTCSICIESVQNSLPNDVVSLPCNHQFHKKCVEPWLIYNRSCPNCRAPTTASSNNMV